MAEKEQKIERTAELVEVTLKGPITNDGTDYQKGDKLKVDVTTLEYLAKLDLIEIKK